MFNFKSLSLSLIAITGLATGTVACTNASHDSAKLTSEARPVGALKGQLLVSKTLAGRMLDAADSQTSQFRVNHVVGEGNESISDFLGRFGDSGDSNEFVNGDANPLGILFWEFTMDALAIQLSETCDNDFGENPQPSLVGYRQFSNVNYKLSSEFAKNLQTICNFSKSENKEVEGLAFWLSLMGFVAPEEEFEAWLKFSSQPDLTEDNKLRAKYMIKTLLLNPYFILES